MTGDVRPFEQTRVAGRDTYVCPGCGQPPERLAVEAGAQAICRDGECIVESYRWWEDD